MLFTVDLQFFLISNFARLLFLSLGQKNRDVKKKV